MRPPSTTLSWDNVDPWGKAAGGPKPQLSADAWLFAGNELAFGLVREMACRQANISQGGHELLSDAVRQRRWNHAARYPVAHDSEEVDLLAQYLLCSFFHSHNTAVLWSVQVCFDTLRGNRALSLPQGLVCFPSAWLLRESCCLLEIFVAGFWTRLRLTLQDCSGSKQFGSIISWEHCKCPLDEDNVKAPIMPW